MPLNATDKAWITLEIQNALKRKGWGKLTGFLKDWSGAGAAITILVLFFTQWTAYVEFRTKTTDRLETIENSLKQISRDTTKQSLVNHAALPVAEFRATLPDLRTTVASALKQQVRVPSTVINGLQQKLVGAEDTPDFWLTAAEFISYRSFNTISWDASRNLKVCVESPPSDAKVSEVKSSTQIVVSAAVYENCKLTLDSPEENRLLNSYLVGRSQQIAFKHCLIVYHGGPVNLILAFKDFKAHFRISGVDHPPEGDVVVSNDHTLEFHDCLFDFSFGNVPSEQGKELTEIFLDTPTSDVTLHLSGQSPS
jgi:hypothetical protein